VADLKNHRAKGRRLPSPPLLFPAGFHRSRTGLGPTWDTRHGLDVTGGRGLDPAVPRGSACAPLVGGKPGGPALKLPQRLTATHEPFRRSAGTSAPARSAAVAVGDLSASVSAITGEPLQKVALAQSDVSRRRPWVWLRTFGLICVTAGVADCGKWGCLRGLSAPGGVCQTRHTWPLNEPLGSPLAPGPASQGLAFGASSS